MSTHHLTDRMEEVDNNQEHEKQPAQNDHRYNHRGGTNAYSVAAFDQNITSRQLLDQAVVEPTNTHYEKTKHASSSASSSSWSQQPMKSSSASYHEPSSLVVLNQTTAGGVQHGGDNSNNGDRGVSATKKLDRILANRRSARRSRERRKQLQDNLEKSIFLLTKQNQVLSRENNELKQELGHLIQMYNKISLDVCANLEKNNVNSSLNQHATTTTRAMMPSPMTCLPPIHNIAASSSASLQELLLYMAALSNNGNKGANVNGIGTSSVLPPLNATTVNGLNTAAAAAFSSASSMAPLATNNTTFPMSNLYTNNIHNAQLNGIGIGGLGGSTVGLGGNHIATANLVNSTANFAYSGGGIMDPSSSFLSSLPYYNDTATTTTGSQMMMNPLRVLHSGQQAFAGSFNGGATNNNLRQF